MRPCLRIFLERILPAKPGNEPISFELSDDNNEYLEEFGQKIILIVSEGNLTAKEALPLSHI
jgi:hypothetical protein